MKTLLKIAFFLLGTAGLASSQDFLYENFSQFTDGHVLVQPSPNNYTTGDGATLCASMYGTGRCDSSNTFAVILNGNTNNALSVVSTSACADGPPPGHTGKFLDYSTSANGGVVSGNQLVFIGYPLVTATTTPSGGSFWFCSTIPASASFGTSFDALQVISGTSRLSNYNSNGSSQNWKLEGVSNATIPYTTGNTVLVTWQFINTSTACAGPGDLTHCVVLRLYDRNFNLIGTDYSGVSGNTPSYITLGNGNGITFTGAGLGKHVQFSDVRLYSKGYSVTQLNSLGVSHPEDGIITPGRYTDWTQVGIAGGIPAYTQCNGTPLVAGNYAGSTISASLAACPSGTFYMLGSGIFNISGQIVFPTAGHRELRGAGASVTRLLQVPGTEVQCNQGTALICGISSDTTNTQSPGTVTSLTAPSQGDTTITVGSTTGVSTTNPTMLMLDQDDTGYTGAPPTGSATDNGAVFYCGDIKAGALGCSADGPDAGGLRVHRGFIEVHTATAVVNSTTLNITPPIVHPDWNGTQTPQMWKVTPIPQIGVKNLSVEGNGSATKIGIEMQSAYNWWVQGVRIASFTTWGYNCLQCVGGNFQDNYVYGMSLTSNPYGVRFMFAANNLVQNNIIQQATTPFSWDGATNNNVFGYNYVNNALFNFGIFGNTNLLQGAYNKHSQNAFDHSEGNIMSMNDNDGIHGNADFEVSFREMLTGYEVSGGALKTAGTNAVNNGYGSRYLHHIAGIYGTPGVHSIYLTQTCPGSNSAVYIFGTTCASFSANDPLSYSTTLLWGVWDSADNTIRWCGITGDTGFNTTCGGVSEAPSTALAFPNFVPTVGDTAIGQGTMPASFYLNAKPSWFGTNPWPPLGPDVTGGNLKICSGTPTANTTNGLPTDNPAKCTTGIANTAWGGHANMNPAMACALDVMGMPLDGSGPMLVFDPVACYSGLTATPTIIQGNIKIQGNSIIQ